MDGCTQPANVNMSDKRDGARACELLPRKILNIIFALVFAQKYQKFEFCSFLQFAQK